MQYIMWLRLVKTVRNRNRDCHSLYKIDIKRTNWQKVSFVSSNRSKQNTTL